MNKQLTSVTIIFILLAVVLTTACTEKAIVSKTQAQIENTESDLKTDSGSLNLESTQQLKKFNSTEEIIEYLKDQQSFSYGGIKSSFGRNALMVEDSVAAPMAAGIARKAESSSGSNGGSASSFSHTNVQVEGVDEADFIKNDDKYIYIISQDKLVIIDAYPAENANILSKTEIDGTPREIFVNGDKLVIFSVTNDESYTIPKYDFMPRPRYAAKTHAFVYDISDRKNPEQVNDYSINGDYFQARMIGDYIYFITKDSVYYYNDFIDVPVLRSNSKMIMPPVYYFDNPDNSYVFHTIASFDIQDDNKVNAETYMMGWSNNLYVSENNIYISYQKNMPYRYYEKDNEDRFYKIVVPLLKQETQDKIDEIKSDSSLSDYEKWTEISDELENMYNTMEKTDKEDLQENIQEAIEEYETKKELEIRKTIIHRIAIKDGEIDYKAKGEVPGYLLNQFSMDEKEGNLRVATTTELWSSIKTQMYNNVYVLDSDLKQTGSLEEIAPDERIYSTRFIGDRLYMVTFQRVDPFFVIDLSSPDPKILGHLKIPGFSDYLHPYDENHIIGIGKETGTNDWGGVSTKGLKIALFDVTDIENPKQIDNYVIGEAGTDSEALREHKAFLFDKGKNILVLPVREVKGQQKYDSRYGYYRQKTWQGAYVFGLTPEKGIELKGKVSHYDDEEESIWYWGSPYSVRRSLYMDDILYTVSAKKVIASDLNDLKETIKEISLPFKQDNYYPVYY